MQDQIISFPTARLAKAKGFNLYCRYSFWKGELTDMTPGYSLENGETAQENYFEFLRYYCPTQSLLQKWLRDNYDIYVSINTITRFYWPSEDEGDQQYLPVHQYRIIQNKDNFKYEVIECNWDYEHYEEALEIGLQQALKLINKIQIPKLTSNNSIIIKPINKKTSFTREEVIEFIYNLLKATGKEIKTTMHFGVNAHVEFDKDTLDKWIDKNL